MYRTTLMSANEWKLPLNIAVGIHVLVLVCSIYLPEILKGKPKFADIYTTVNIINMAEPEAAAPAPQPVQQQPEPVPTISKPIKSKQAVAIAEITKKPNTAPPKAISLKPLKRKKIKKIKKTNNASQQRELDRLRREKLAALQEEKLLEEKARLAKEALEAEKRLLAKKPVQNTASTPPKATGKKQSASRNSTGSSNLIENQYFASIVNRLHQFWALPENLQKNPNLTAVAVITVRKNGSIANLMFESKSGDRVFDQFVRKAIRSADPLPPIPPALKRQRIEIGLRFKPGSIQ